MANNFFILTMGKFSKNLASILILIVAISSLTILVVKPTNAQSIPKPSVPEFILKYVDYSYDIPPTYGTNPYNGQTEITNPGQHVDKKSLEVWIKNQPFAPYTDADGHKIILGYGINWKGHFTNVWTYNPSENNYFLASGAEYTVISYGFDGDSRDDYPIYWLSGLISTGDQLDFQVEAFIGYYVTAFSPPDPLFGRTHEYQVFTGKTSDWSGVQTITLDVSSPIVTPNPGYSPLLPSTLTSSPSTSPSTPTSTLTQTSIPSPTVPEFSWLVIVPLLLSLFSIAVIVRHRKPTRTNQ